jgi:hypothetical protein
MLGGVLGALRDYALQSVFSPAPVLASSGGRQGILFWAK